MESRIVRNFQLANRGPMVRPACRFPLSALSRALRGGVYVMALTAGVAWVPGAAVAADRAPAAQPTQRYAIQGGALAAALRQIAATANVLLTFDPQLVGARQASPLNGQYAVADAFAVVLQGSDLQVVHDGGQNYRLVRAAAAPAVMPAVSVSASGLAASATTEGSGAYTTAAMRTATGLSLSPRETPQSVSVMSRQQIEDQGLTTLDDAVQGITGLVMQKGYYQGDSGSFSARGFPVANLLLDGLPVGTGANGTFNADNDALDIYDRVEVVRGATGLTTGAGTPSAAINLVRKRPTAEPQGSLTLSAGSWRNLRVAVDGGGPLNATGSLRARAVATVQDTKQFYDVAHDRNHQLYGILEADLTPATVATLGFHYRKVDNDGSFATLPTRADGRFFAGLKRDTNLSNDFDYWRQTDKTAFAELLHTFGNDWQAKLAAVWKRPEQDLMFSGLGRIDGVLHQNTQRYRLDNRQDSYELSLNGPLSLFGRTHEMMLGTSYRSFDNDNWGGWAAYSWTAASPVVDPYAWDASSVPRPDVDMSLWSQVRTTRQKGVWAAGRFDLADPLKLIVGARLNWYARDQQGGNGMDFKATREVTPYAGVLYDLDHQHTAYASWTEIFEPQGATDRNGKLLDPITGTNYELGIKGAYFDGRLNASLATFLIKQQNRATDDLAGPNPCPGSSWGYCQRASGEVESKGIEAEVSGALTPDWQVSAGYTYVSAKFTKDAERSNIGTLFDPDLPRHQLKLATRYRLAGGLQRWRVGGNLYAQNRVFSGDDDRIAQGGYAIAGLHVGYALGAKTDLRLNVNNLFDKKYYANVGWATGGNAFGTPRNVSVTLQHAL